MASLFSLPKSISVTALILSVSSANVSATALSESIVDFDLDSMIISGDITPYVYDSAPEHVVLPLPHTGIVSMVSAYGSNAESWYGYYYGGPSDIVSVATVDHAVGGANFYMPPFSNRTLAGAGAIADGDINTPGLAEEGPGFAESWVFGIYGFTANSTGQVDFSIDYGLTLDLTTSGLGESARGWAYAGVHTYSTFPEIDAADIQIHPDFPQDIYINGNDIFSLDNYSDKLIQEVSDGAIFQTSQLGKQLTTTTDVIAGQTYFITFAGHAGAAGFPAVNNVPEPSVFFLISAGLGLIGVISRRRRI